MYGGMFDALTTAQDSKESQANARFYKTFLQEVAFILKTMPVILHRARTFMEFLSCSVRNSFPEQGVTCYSFLHSAEVRYFTHKRSRPCCTTRRTFLSTLSLVWGPVFDPSHSLCFSTTPHAHPFVGLSSPLSLGRLFRTKVLPYTIRIDCSRHPTVHHRPQELWDLRDPTHVHVVPQDLQRTALAAR